MGKCTELLTLHCGEVPGRDVGKESSRQGGERGRQGLVSRMGGVRQASPPSIWEREDLCADGAQALACGAH